MQWFRGMLLPSLPLSVPQFFGQMVANQGFEPRTNGL